jgi:hypothetical protein
MLSRRTQWRPALSPRTPALTITAPTTGTLRLYNELAFDVYHAPFTYTDFIAPSIWHVEAISSSRYLKFRVQVDDDRFAIQRTVVLYRTLDSTTWSKAELVYDETTGWATGTVDPVDSPIEYLAQAVDSTGNVALALDHGVPFRGMKAAVELPTAYLPIVARNYAGVDRYLYLPAVLR